MFKYKIMSALTLYKQADGSYKLEFDSPQIPTQELADMYSALSDGKEVYAGGGQYSKESTPDRTPIGRIYNFLFKVNNVSGKNEIKPSFNITLTGEGHSETVVR